MTGDPLAWHTRYPFLCNHPRIHRILRHSMLMLKLDGCTVALDGSCSGYVYQALGVYIMFSERDRHSQSCMLG